MNTTLKRYEIWIGKYHLGQGYDPPTESQKVGEENASSFPIACMKYELRSKLKWLDSNDGFKHITNQDLNWYYNPFTNSNSWTGQYYESKEQADNSFK